jgi:homoserine kinase type II
MSAREDHDAISTGEIASVCAHYDLGVVREVRPLGRGARGGKAVLTASTGSYLLKRRRHAEDPRRVALSHDIQIHLRAAGFPVPELVGTRGERNSMLQLGGRVYEMFRFVPGGPYDGSPAATASAGRTLAEYHRLLRDFTPRWDAPARGYHALPGIGEALIDGARRAGLGPTERSAARELARRYDAASRETARLGYDALPRQVVHGDWHPGNLLFDSGVVRAVVDHDSAGVGARVADLAYGLLHFSLNRGRVRAAATAAGAHEGSLMGPSSPDTTRLAAFASGYHERSDPPLSPAEAACAPWLMIEAAGADAAGMLGEATAAPPAEGSGLLGALADLAGRIAASAGVLANIIGRGAAG